MSTAPLRSMDRISGVTFLPTDWNIVMMTMATGMQGPVTQMMRWKRLP